MSGRNRTFDLVLGEVTALFTTGIEHDPENRTPVSERIMLQRKI
jgi:hypothetical protein